MFHKLLKFSKMDRFSEKMSKSANFCPEAPIQWSYQATYRVGETQVGLWSAPVSITVSA